MVQNNDFIVRLAKAYIDGRLTATNASDADYYARTARRVLSNDSILSPLLKKSAKLALIADSTTWDVITGAGSIGTSAAGNVTFTTPSGANYTIRRATRAAVGKGGAIIARIKRDANISVLDFRVRTLNKDGVTTNTYGYNMGLSALPVGQWYDLVFTFAGANQPASPDAQDHNRITGIEFGITPNASTVSVLEVESIKLVESNNQSGIVFHFDDGRDDTYTVAYPILKKAGYRGNIAVEHTTVGTAGRCTLSQLSEMYNNGWDLFGHHTAQMTSLDVPTQNSVHQASKDFLLNNGFIRAIDHWVWPGGARDAVSDGVAQKYWKTRRPTATLVPGVASVGNYDGFDPATYYFMTSTTVANVKAMIDRVAMHGGVLALVNHSLVTTKVAPEDVLISDYQAVVDYAKASNLQDYTWSETFI